MDVEARMGTEMAKRALWLGPLVVVVAALIGGSEAALAALVGAVVVTLTYWGSSWLMSLAARRSPEALGAAAMGGFLGRLVVLTAVVWVLVSVFELDLIGLFLGIGVTYIGLIVLQARKELVVR